MRVVLVPGFSQTAAAWDPVRAAMDADTGAEAVALDIPTEPTFPTTAQRLGALGGAGVYVGYSLGARLCLQLALDHPDLVRALMLVSGTPGIPDEGERAARSRQDEAQALDVEGRGSVAFLTEWLAQPMFRSVPSPAREVSLRAASMPPARLAHQMRTLGQGAMVPLWDRLGSLAMPVTVVVGQADPKYAAIGAAIVDRIPDATLVELPGGHALPLETPGPLAARIDGVHASTR